MDVNTAIIYYSATGTVHALARAAAEGAEKAGAQVRLRTVAELAPPEAIDARPEWARHRRDTADIAEAGLDDLAWADVVLFGTPTRFGNVAAQLKAFLDSTGPLWLRGGLADKVYSAFTASNTAHGGQESTLLSMMQATGSPLTAGISSTAIVVLSRIMTVFSFALVMLRTLYAKWLYRKSAAERIRRIRAEFPDAAQRRAVLSAQGGVSIAGVIGAFVLLMVLGACATVLMGPNLDALAGML